jgi:hypothetical protein
MLHSDYFLWWFGSSGVVIVVVVDLDRQAPIDWLILWKSNPIQSNQLVPYMLLRKGRRSFIRLSTSLLVIVDWMMIPLFAPTAPLPRWTLHWTVVGTTTSAWGFSNALRFLFLFQWIVQFFHFVRVCLLLEFANRPIILSDRRRRLLSPTVLLLSLLLLSNVTNRCFCVSNSLDRSKDDSA